MNYPPPWMDRITLAEHICVSDTTIDNWVAQGILPPARKRGGKLMWRWSEVDEWLTLGGPDKRVPGEDKAREIRDATRRALQERSASH
jgi:predicted DNA-binding transcriptional regulator AlpA